MVISRTYGILTGIDITESSHLPKDFFFQTRDDAKLDNRLIRIRLLLADLSHHHSSGKIFRTWGPHSNSTLLIGPERSEIFFGELHNSMEPIPKGEASIGQRLFAKLRPTDKQIGKIVVDIAHRIRMAKRFGS